MLLPFVLLALVPAGAAKHVVRTASDLPRFSYPIQGQASALVRDGGPDFDALAARLKDNVDEVLRDYQIDDRATLRALLITRLELECLAGNARAGLRTIAELRTLQDKPAAKLTSGLTSEAILEAQLATGQTHGAEFDAALDRRYRALVEPLPWSLVADWATSAYVSARTYSRSVALAGVMTDIDPAARTSGAVDMDEAGDLVATREDLIEFIATGPVRARVLQAYIAAHRRPKPDIWAAREFTLTADMPATPVVVGIWDSGIDLNDYPGQVYFDRQATPSGRHGLALDDQGAYSRDWLYPLTAAQQAAYPLFQATIRGRYDMLRGLDTSAAREMVRLYTTQPPEALHNFFEAEKVLGFYCHGTHCAGIAVRGNAAARLVVARFDDQLPDLPFPPTQAWVERFAADFHAFSDYFRTRHVRVVNMSWGDSPSEFEQWLIKTGQGGDPAARKAKAERLYQGWREGVRAAMAGSPDTLFVCAAGNADANSSFEEQIPAAFHLPNLLVVGAVNQAGQETSFTSYGDTVAVYADGYEVESGVPGGGRLPLSGTSMASPNVVNLAAKLIALDPSLTPEQTISLIRRGATPSPDGRLHLIDERRSVALLRSRAL